MPITTPIETIKFSEMPSGGDLAPGELTPGLLSGENVLFNNPWTFLAPGSTASRPVPSVDIDGRLRFNTDTLFYEYYDTISSTWVELSGSGTGTVNPGSVNAIAYYAANGTVVSPLNPSVNSVLAANGSGVPSFVTTLPAGLSIPGATITSSTAALSAGSVVAEPVSGSDIVNKTYADGLYSASVHSITGTTNQVIASSPTGDVTLSLPQDIALGSTPEFLDLKLTGADILDINGNVILNFNAIGSAVNYIEIANNISGSNPEIGSRGSDTDISMTYRTKAAGIHQFISDNTTVPIIWNTGTTAQHTTQWAVPDTAQNRTITLQDASGTMAYISNIPSVTPSALTKTDDTNVTMTLGGSPTVALLAATSLTLGWNGQLSLARGGSNANLTASNGGIVYSGASAMAILSGTATATQMLQSGTSSAPAWSTTTWPATSTINQILYSASSNAISGLATANNGVLVTSSGGVPSISTTLPSGIAATNMNLTTPTLGAASATSINFGQTTLNNYQEGTWTPSDNSGASLVFTSVVGNYTRVGRMVIATCTLSYPVTADTSVAGITGLPFTSANSTGSIGGVISYSTASTLSRGLVVQNTKNFNLYTSAGVPILNSAMSNNNNYFIAIYFV